MKAGQRYARRLWWLSIVLAFGFPSQRVWAHGIVGRRMFIEPLFAEDANIKNELDLPRAEFLQMPDGSFRNVSAAFEKALWPDRWSLTVEQSRIYQHRPGGATVAGFDDLEFGIKVAVYRDERHELVLTPALSITAPTGSRKLGEDHWALHPRLLFGKGLGDVKLDYLRPVALQGDVGYQASVSGAGERQITYDMVFEYSVPYLNHFVRNADAGFNLEHNLRLGHSPQAILGDMFPFVEFNGSTPVARTTGSTATFLRPGALYMGKYLQVGAAADLPLRGYPPGRRVGGVVLLDLFLDEISPAFDWAPFGKHRHHQRKD